MTTAETQAWDTLGQLVGVVIAEVASLKDGIAQKDAALQAAQAALADADATAAQQVQDALDADSASDVTRVQGLVDQLKGALPDGTDVPDVPVPDPGQPADNPVDSGDTGTGDGTQPSDGSGDVVNPTPVDDQGNPVPPANA